MVWEVFIIGFGVSVADRRYASAYTTFDEKKLINVCKQLQLDAGMLETRRQAETGGSVVVAGIKFVVGEGV